MGSIPSAAHIERKGISDMSAEYLKAKIGHLKAQRDRAIADAECFRSLNDALIEDNEQLQSKLEQTEALWQATAKTLQDEIDRLTLELAEERKEHSKVVAFWSSDQCEFNRLRAENENLKKALDSARHSMGVCEESYKPIIQKLHSENAQLRAELADERDRHDRLQDFEVAEAKQYAEVKAKAERAGMAYNVVMRLLEQQGYPVGPLFIETAMLVAAEERKAKCDRG